MYIRTLPPSRRSRNRRRNGRWIRCAILDRQWVAPNASIDLYLLDEKRREVQRACDAGGAPINFHADSSAWDLERVADRLGEGLYRLVARDPAGRILVRRDFAAARWSMPEVGARQYAPRTEVETVRAELAEARHHNESMAAERDAMRAEIEALKATLAEREAMVGALEGEVERRGEQLDRARRLYAQMGAGRQAPESASRQVPESASRQAHESASRQTPEHPSAPEEQAAPTEGRVVRLRAGKGRYQARRRGEDAGSQRDGGRGGQASWLDPQTFEQYAGVIAHHLFGRPPPKKRPDDPPEPLPSVPSEPEPSLSESPPVDVVSSPTGSTRRLLVVKNSARKEP